MQKYSKAIVAVIAFLAMLVANGFISGSAATVVNAIIALAGSLGVYQVENK